MRTKKKKMEDEVHKLNIMVVRLNGEAQNLDYDIERSKKLIQEIEGTITQRLAEIDQAKRDIERQTAETAELEQSLVRDFNEKDAMEKLKREREEAYHLLREELQNKEKDVRQVRHDREEVSEKIHQLQMEISELDHQVQTLRSHLHENYAVELEKLACPETFILEEAEQEIEDLRRKIKGLGPVNLVALQEYEQEKGRLDFLLQQREDLLSAEGTLKETIQKINETARHGLPRCSTRSERISGRLSSSFSTAARRIYGLPRARTCLRPRSKFWPVPRASSSGRLTFCPAAKRRLRPFPCCFPFIR